MLNGTSAVYTQGNVGVGVTSPAGAFEVVSPAVNGTIRGTVVSQSDARWKKDIQPIAHALDTVTRLEGVSYEWRTDEFPEQAFAAGRQIGVLAQQVETVVPELVVTDRDGYKAVNYPLTVPLLIEAVKELKQQNEALRARVDQLEQTR